MDKNETYIKMCNCPEIQDRWDNGKCTVSEWARSYFIARKDMSLIHYYDFEEYPEHSKDYIWLPTQEQLQAMVPEEELSGGLKVLKNSINLISRINGWIFFFCDAPDNADKLSMCQLWLAFVMHELFSKEWDGEKWTTKKTTRRRGSK